ncbi:5-oxoprolinase subunit PxpB [Alkalicoccobacillus plakortidis]|uniref:5-oxoprolinase subunit PxpB n=1 Tax=Alkalicoccobacillus plakortidis TaxID=444060 RepID=A0ABT0XI10_9BACI|nr:5-oxoprolinase subunit PxpB [Alkalicoccobacillus plakortidis]MCM2675390.1 5-oxoprolinase subunit PxpB [Alkalicoccobacillus plakortidis]
MGEISLFPHIYSLNETSMIVQFADKIDPNTQKNILALIDLLKTSPFPGFLESLPSYTGVAVFYDPALVLSAEPASILSPSDRVRQLLDDYIISSKHHQLNVEPETIEIPVCYDWTLGPDLQEVADYNQLTVDDVISIHSKGSYQVYMIGFAPGFPFLGGMSESIATPRKQQPRLEIPAGSVGIAGKQTGVYPMVTPGGWQLIGQTPLKMFDLNRDEPSLLKPGHIVRFRPISLEEYQDLKERD